MDRPSNSVHHCVMQIAAGGQLPLCFFRVATQKFHVDCVECCVRKYGDRLSHTQMRPGHYVVVTFFFYKILKRGGNSDSSPGPLVYVNGA